MSEPLDPHAEEALGKAYDARLLRRLLRYLRPYTAMSLGALALILASSLLQLVGPIATAVALDLFVRPDGPGAEQSPAGRALAAWMARHQVALDPASGLALCAAVFLGSVLLAFVVLYAQAYLLQ